MILHIPFYPVHIFPLQFDCFMTAYRGHGSWMSPRSGEMHFLDGDSLTVNGTSSACARDNTCRSSTISANCNCDASPPLLNTFDASPMLNQWFHDKGRGEEKKIKKRLKPLQRINARTYSLHMAFTAWCRKEPQTGSTYSSSRYSRFSLWPWDIFIEKFIVISKHAKQLYQKLSNVYCYFPGRITQKDLLPIQSLQ